MNTGKKLLIFAKHLDGGTGTFVEQLKKLEIISKKELKVHVIALEKPQFRKLLITEHSIEFYSNTQLLPYAYLLTPAAFMNFIRELLWFRRKLQDVKPDIILSIDNHCNVLNCISTFFFFQNIKCKRILTIHNNISAVVFAKLPVWSKGIFQKVCRFLFSFAEEIICVSQGVAYDTQRFFSLKKLPRVIYVSVDAQKISALSKLPLDSTDSKKFRRKKLKILSVGRFAAQKDFRTLIKAVALIKSKVQLFLIGDGPEKNELIAITKSLQVDKDIHFLGWKQNIYPYVKATDCFVLSSNYEGFPYVLLEAAALKKPIIATDTPYGPNEFLGNSDYGIIVPVGQPEKIAESLICLCNKRKYAHYQKIIGTRIVSFSEKSMLNSYLKIIYSLLD